MWRVYLTKPFLPRHLDLSEKTLTIILISLSFTVLSSVSFSLPTPGKFINPVPYHLRQVKFYYKLFNEILYWIPYVQFTLLVHPLTRRSVLFLLVTSIGGLVMVVVIFPVPMGLSFLRLSGWVWCLVDRSKYTTKDEKDTITLELVKGLSRGLN